MYNDVSDVLKKLNVSSPNEIDKNNIHEFVELMPEMSEELCISLIKLVPRFCLMMKDIAQTALEASKFVADSNNNNTRMYLDNGKERLKILEILANSSNPNPEIQKEIIHYLRDNDVNESRMFEKDKSLLEKNAFRVPPWILNIGKALLWTGGTLALIALFDKQKTNSTEEK